MSKTILGTGATFGQAGAAASNSLKTSAGSLAEALADISENNARLAAAQGLDQGSSPATPVAEPPLLSSGIAPDALTKPGSQDTASQDVQSLEVEMDIEPDRPLQGEPVPAPATPPAFPPALLKRRSEPPAPERRSEPPAPETSSISSDIDERFEKLVSIAPPAIATQETRAGEISESENAAPLGPLTSAQQVPQTTDQQSSGLESSGLESSGLEEARKLFVELSGAHLGPLRDLMIEVELADPTREWLSVCRPAVVSLSQAARELAMPSLVTALENMRAALDDASRNSGIIIDQRGRDVLRAAYQSLVAELPQAFSVSQERDRREPLIVQSLLLQVPDVRKVALDRMYAAGLSSLEHFYRAKPADIAETAGIAREVAERIVARFQRYRRETGSTPPATRRARERSQLENLVRKLEDQNSAYEASSKHFAASEEKRRLRQERSATLLEVNLLLARAGELQLVELLERSTFQAKAEALRRYLSERSD